MDETMPSFALDPLDLAALLCSHVCHDVIGPVGAIVNGLEILDEEKDAETRGFALELIKKSAETASARLQFCRLAFGAAGSAAASIDTLDAEKLVRGLFGAEKTLEWTLAPMLLPKDQVKLILNLCVLASVAIPRGGVINVRADGVRPEIRFAVSARGKNAKLSPQQLQLLAGAPDPDSADARSIQAYYAGLLAKSARMTLSVTQESDLVTIEALPLVTMGSSVPMPEDAR
jgi:histidine phosphotransferase ChpT